MRVKTDPSSIDAYRCCCRRKQGPAECVYIQKNHVRLSSTGVPSVAALAVPPRRGEGDISKHESQGLGAKWAIRRVLQAVVEAGQFDVARALVESSAASRGAAGGRGAGEEEEEGGHEGDEVCRVCDDFWLLALDGYSPLLVGCFCSGSLEFFFFFRA